VRTIYQLVYITSTDAISCSEVSAYNPKWASGNRCSTALEGLMMWSYWLSVWPCTIPTIQT